MEKKKWLLTEDPAIIFEDTAVGRMKKAVWDMTEEQLDAELAAYGPVTLQDAFTRGGVAVKRIRVGSFTRAQDAQKALDQISQAFDRVVRKDVRYRFVIDLASAKA